MAQWLWVFPFFFIFNFNVNLLVLIILNFPVWQFQASIHEIEMEHSCQQPVFLTFPCNCHTVHFHHLVWIFCYYRWHSTKHFVQLVKKSTQVAWKKFAKSSHFPVATIAVMQNWVGNNKNSRFAHCRVHYTRHFWCKLVGILLPSVTFFGAT